jgi:predicted nucleic acid-binding protein
VKVALDSYVLLYAAGVWKVKLDSTKTAIIRPFIDRLHRKVTVVCPWQVLGECYTVMVRHGRSRNDCCTVIRHWRDKFECAARNASAFESALDLATEHQLQLWDALIINAAADTGCEILLSEDLQPGFHGAD